MKFLVIVETRYDNKLAYKKEHNNIYLAVDDFKEKCREYSNVSYIVQLIRK